MQGSPDQKLGSYYENLALDFLTANGLRLVTRNFHCRSGELDLILLDRECLVFAEVRYRQSGSMVSAAESVGWRKQRRLTKAAEYFLLKNRSFQDHTMRFDVIAFDGSHDTQTDIEWIQDAFRPGG